MGKIKFMSTELKKITINSFKGIAESSPVIIDFNDTDKNIVYLQGDQHMGKTSTLEGIMWLMGASLGVGIKEMYNSNHPIDEEMEFEHDGKPYKVIASADKIVVKSLREGDGSTKDKWVNEPSPKDLLQKIFKKCIIEQKFQYEKPEKQVEWVGNLFPLPLEVKKAIADAQTEIKRMREVVRPQLGNEAKGYEALLNANPLYAEYQEKGEALEKEIKKLDKAQDKLDIKEISGRFQQYQIAIQKLENLNREHDKVKWELNELEIAINLKKTEVDSVAEKLEIGKKYISDNKKVVAEYEKAMKLQEDSAEITLRVDGFEKMKLNLAKYNEISDRYAEVDGNIKEATANIKSLKADYIPPVEGLEIVTDVEMEGGAITKDIGIYFNGINLRTLCGSEYVTSIIKIIRASGSRYIFIDDIATYGSETIEYINNLAKEIKPQGGVIFAAEMQRGDELTISMEENI